MLTYSNDDMKKCYESLFGITKSFKAIGHHSIGRNLVFLVDNEKVFKVYFKPNKAINEMRSIPLVKQKNLLCPKILAHGQIPNGEDFILFSKIDGLILDSIEDKLNPSELEGIYYQMGKVLGTLHTIKVPKYFESWTLDDKNQHCKSLRASTIYNVNLFFDKIKAEDHDDYQVIKKGYDSIMSNLSIFDGNHEVVLSHHDFSKRNVMIIKKDIHNYHGLIDFEHTKPADLDLEMVDTYLPLLERNKHIARIFLEGYTSVRTFDSERFKTKMHYYNIYIGIVTCSWAKEKAYEFYLSGLKKIKTSLKAIT